MCHKERLLLDKHGQKRQRIRKDLPGLCDPKGSGQVKDHSIETPNACPTMANDIIRHFRTIPKSKFGNTYIIMTVERFAKWVEAQPATASTTDRVVAFLELEIFARWGVPEVIISDQGPQFLGNKY